MKSKVRTYWKDDWKGYWKKRNQIIEDFHVLYYFNPDCQIKGWRGVGTHKCANDIWLVQEIVYINKPDYYIECGTGYGGFTLFVADFFNILGKGKVITVDIDHSETSALVKQHPRIVVIDGDSTSKTIFAKVKKELSPSGTVMVDLDSDHETPHVMKELQMYGELVTLGQYMICEDTNVNGVHRALEGFVKKSDGKWFVDCKSWGRYLFTYNPGGYLIRVK